MYKLKYLYKGTFINQIMKTNILFFLRNFLFFKSFSYPTNSAKGDPNLVQNCIDVESKIQ